MAEIKATSWSEEWPAMKEIVDHKGTKILDVSTMLVEFNEKLGCNGKEIDTQIGGKGLNSEN